MKAINRSELPVGTCRVLGDGISGRFNNDLPRGGGKVWIIVITGSAQAASCQDFLFLSFHSLNFSSSSKTVRVLTIDMLCSHFLKKRRSDFFYW